MLGVFFVDYVTFDRLCKANNTTATALTLKLGLSKGNTNSWKKGGNPSVDILVKLADELNCTTDELLGRQNNCSKKVENSQNETLEIFREFDDREQVKIIGRMEEWLEVKHQREAISQKQRIVGVQVARRTDGRFVKEPVTAEEMEKIKALPEDTDY